MSSLITETRICNSLSCLRTSFLSITCIHSSLFTTKRIVWDSLGGGVGDSHGSRRSVWYVTTFRGKLQKCFHFFQTKCIIDASCLTNLFRLTITLIFQRINGCKIQEVDPNSIHCRKPTSKSQRVIIITRKGFKRVYNLVIFLNKYWVEESGHRYLSTSSP